MKNTILVVDDEPDIRELVQYNLKKAGYSVLTAGDGTAALRCAREAAPALIVLDLLLPDLEGTDVCRLLKEDARTRTIPVIMLTAKGEEIDRVVGLELGADDYIVKPFSPRELVLRIKAVLRRMTPDGSAPQAVRIGPLALDVEGHRATVDETPVSLTATEFKLLAVLFQRRGRVQSRDELLDAVWDYAYMGYERTVDAHIKRLRKKLGNAGSLIETVRGVGYRFVK